MEVVFYVLPTETPGPRLEFACKLIEKIFRGGQHCFALVDDAQQAAALDTLLWTFRAGSFVPHQIYQGVLPLLPQTILIGYGGIPEGRRNIIINLSLGLPPHDAGAERIVEIIDNSAGSKQAGRERYRYYQQLGVDVVTHNRERSP